MIQIIMWCYFKVDTILLYVKDVRAAPDSLQCLSYSYKHIFYNNAFI